MCSLLCCYYYLPLNNVANIPQALYVVSPIFSLTYSDITNARPDHFGQVDADSKPVENCCKNSSDNCLLYSPILQTCNKINYKGK